MYNLRAKYYENGTIQITTFSRPVIVKGKNHYEEYSLDDDIWHEEIEKSFGLEHEKQKREKNNSSDDDTILKKSMSRAKKQVVDYGRNNVWEWFLTFTFASDKVKSRKNYDDLSSKIRKWFSNQKRNLTDEEKENAKYLIIPEQHKDGAWHFHALVSGYNFNYCEAISPKTGKKLTRRGDQIYNIGSWGYGFTEGTRIRDTKKAVNYVIKYITKDMSRELFGKQKYFVSNNCTLPKVVTAFETDKNKLQDFVNEIAVSNGFNITNRKEINIDTFEYKNIITYYELE